MNNFRKVLFCVCMHIGLQLETKSSHWATGAFFSTGVGDLNGSSWLYAKQLSPLSLLLSPETEICRQNRLGYEAYHLDIE